MFWSEPSLPLKPEEQQWLDRSLRWLLEQFGMEYFLKHPMILPEPSFFPDPFRGTEECVNKLVSRVCSYMDVDYQLIEVRIFSAQEFGVSESRYAGERSYAGAAGLFRNKKEPNGKMKVAICDSQLKHPTKLVATIAHELGHVILLGGGKISREDKSHELLTDLITVFLGMGIFTANSAFQFGQWQDHSRQGWSASRQGYMSEEMLAYSLAACAWMKGDTKAAWQKHLAMNVGYHFKECFKYLNKGGQTTLVKVQGQAG
jgi:hypothetical protein